MNASAAQYSPEFLAEDNSAVVLATSSLMIIFCTLFVGLRYYARHLTSTSFGAEDVLIPFAWFSEVCLCIVGIEMVKLAGTGRHLAFNVQNPEKITNHLKGIVANEFLHPAAVALPKLCVIILYLRIFTRKVERMAAWGLMFLVSATWISYFVANIFQCTPFNYNWNKTIPGGHCFNVVAFALSSSAPNIVTDLIVIFLPIRTVIELKVSRGRKIGLMLIFLTGSVGIIASIVRTAVFAQTNILGDMTFTNVPLVTWTIIEPGLYLLAACALSFKPLFRMVAKVLHLNALLTHTKSAFNKSSHVKTNATQQTDIHMETFKTASSGGFTKLGDGKDGDEPTGIVVTRTVEVKGEDEDSQVRKSDNVV